MATREDWHEDFIAYTERMVDHPVYEGMPDPRTDGGEVQWEAPSNRKSGKYAETHRKRLDWWRNKAEEVGVDTNINHWKSRTAKKIHPTGEKPCRRCGRVLRLDYVYPNGHLKNRLEKKFGTFEYDPLEEIGELIQRLYDTYGEDILADLPELLETGSIDPPELGKDLDAWLTWVEDEYIPREPSMLSPGAMSNAPDRFDGFHHFNRCCRGEADTGRHDENLRSYTTDRRVFEHWNGGDWVAADRLMGLMQSQFRDAPTYDDKEGQATPDHIGPLALGFKHLPVFRALSGPANSAKGDRLALQDVKDLIRLESDSTKVTSWFATPLWDLRKHDVDSEEEALRLSKLLRDNRQNAMELLHRVLKAGHYTFLADFLNLECADFSVEFEGLEINEDRGCITEYDTLVRTERNTEYAREQKARRLRVAFESLYEYGEKENRQTHLISTPQVEKKTLAALSALEDKPEPVEKVDRELHDLFNQSTGRPPEGRLREIGTHLTDMETPSSFQVAQQNMEEAMEEIGAELSSKWGDDRYVRQEM